MSETDKIMTAFKRFAGSAVDLGRPDIEERRFVYCLVRIDGADMVGTLSKAIEVAVRSGGDANQFVGDVLLVLFGVPLESTSIHSELATLVRSLADLDVTAVIGEDVGLYGAFGYEKRKIVTAISARLKEDLAQLRSLPETKLYMHRDLAEVITGLLPSVDSVQLL